MAPDDAGPPLGTPAVPCRTPVATAEIRSRAGAKRTRMAARHRRQHDHLSHALLGIPAAGFDRRSAGLRSEQPPGLAFQWRAIERSLVMVAASLGGTPDDTLDEAVAQVGEMELRAIDGGTGRAERARQALAEQLNGLSRAAGRLSDRLSLKHFSLID